MPIFDYILLTVLGAGGSTMTAPPLRTIDADALRQPRGGAISDFSRNQSGQLKLRLNSGSVRAEKGPGKKPRRHRHRRHRHPQPDALTIKQK